MRFLLSLILAATAAAAQSTPQVQFSHTAEGLRGVSAVSRQIAWASGTHGTYLRTIDGGRTWTPAQVPDAATLDFRAVVAFSATDAFLMSSGPGDQSRIYHTIDAGRHWQLQFTNTNPKGFFDSMQFWDPAHGIVLGDPIPDETGKLHFELLKTEDGQAWHQIPLAQLPEAIEGEGAFAASNSCIAIFGADKNIMWGQPPSAVRSGEARQYAAPSNDPPDPNIWFATGGKTARVFHSSDAGKTWNVFDTPILHGQDSTGIFSIAFRDSLHGVIAGGDYKRPNDDGPNLAFTDDGGKTWTLSQIKPQAFYSAVAYDIRVNQEAIDQESDEAKEKKIRIKPVAPQRLFVVGHDFIFDFRPPNNPRRVSGRRKHPLTLNAVSPFPEGGALIVGANGAVVLLP